MNIVNLIGNVVRDPELKQTTSGKYTTTINIAVQRISGGEKKADFFEIVVWEKLAENVVKNCRKGSKVGVTGSLINESWEKDGKKQYRTKINAISVDFMKSPENTGIDVNMASAPTVEISEDDELPF